MTPFFCDSNIQDDPLTSHCADKMILRGNKLTLEEFGIKRTLLRALPAVRPALHLSSRGDGAGAPWNLQWRLLITQSNFKGGNLITYNLCIETNK